MVPFLLMLVIMTTVKSSEDEDFTTDPSSQLDYNNEDPSRCTKDYEDIDIETEGARDCKRWMDSANQHISLVPDKELEEYAQEAVQMYANGTCCDGVCPQLRECVRRALQKIGVEEICQDEAKPRMRIRKRVNSWYGRSVAFRMRCGTQWLAQRNMDKFDAGDRFGCGSVSTRSNGDRQIYPSLCIYCTSRPKRRVRTLK